jgi:large subunit ribosomal protein L4
VQANVVDLRGGVVRSIDLDDRVFGIEPNQAVVHQAVVAQQANARHGTADTKTRGEVAGGGKKPYRQKGTGYARQGSTRAPHYRKGGIVFGPHPRSFNKDLPRKMRRLAMRSVLSARLAEDALTVVDRFELAEARTRVLLEALAGLGAEHGAVVVLGERSDPVLRAAKNLERVHVVTPNGLNLLDLLRLPRVVLTESAVEELTRTLTRDLGPSAAPPAGSSGGSRAERSGSLVAEGANEPEPPLPAEVTQEAVVQEAEAAEVPAASERAPEPAETAPTDEEHQP